MRFLKKKIVAAWLGILSAIGVGQYSRPPVMDDVKPPIEITAEPTPAPVVVIPEPASQVPIEIKRPRIEIKSIRGATAQEIVMIEKGFEMANLVLASDWFKGRVLSAVFTETNGLTNQQIYDKLASDPIRVDVEMFTGTRWQNYVSKTMGYDIGDGVVYMNRFYVEDAETVGSLSTHEGEGHGQNFRHDFVKATSVPYQWNDLIEEGYKVLKVSGN